MPAGLLNSNMWLAAAFAEHPAHAVARGVLRTASAEEPALWCRATQQNFLRLASTPVITAAYDVPKARPTAMPGPPCRRSWRCRRWM